MHDGSIQVAPTVLKLFLYYMLFEGSNPETHYSYLLWFVQDIVLYRLWENVSSPFLIQKKAGLLKFKPAITDFFGHLGAV